MTTGDVAIRVRDVSHQFGEPGDKQHVRALLDTSLDIQRRVLQRLHELRIARLAKLMRDVSHPDRDIARFHFGRYASVRSFDMSGFSGRSLVSTKDVASTSSAFASKCPVVLRIGMVSL